MAASAKIRKLEPGAVRQNEKRVRNQVSRGEPFNRSQALGHVKGSIVRLKMENFMIYDNCQFQPGPHLNVLIGPNGTGKSTIVCAICLVLAGKTSLLGRSKEVGEYVKYGHNSAVLEVELCNPAEGNTVIRREITRQGNTSTWRVNGRVTTLREVEETVKNHDIQLANLCQFLPQDKVAEFAKMSKEDLLENTEKSVGQPELYEYHQKLKDSRKKEIALIKAHRDDKELLDKLKQKNSRLESDEYINALERFNSLKEQVKEVRANFDRVKAENAPLQSRITALMTRITELDTELKEKSNEIRSLANSAKAKNGSIEKLVDDMIQVQDELKEKKRKKKKGRKMLLDYGLV
ncbi:structural maintenance of chromosomes protein 5-like [Ptychodera flava]|uniref:structural maintenance of chromosomes protein 5-like n=1 Tax=Ptychodera flava TaxID=63121 RepID=UPI00396AA3C7